MTQLSTLVNNINDQQTVEENVYKLAEYVEKDHNNRWESLPYNVEVKKGRKYYKIITNNSVHAFVDVNNGDVYKPASYNKPAKHVRYNLLQDPQTCFNKCDWSGGYLYL